MGKSIAISILLSLSLVSIRAQFEVANTTIDFGLLERGSERVLEREIINSGDKDATLLRVELGNKEFDIRTDKRKVLAGDTLRLRVKLNPVSKGLRSDNMTLIFDEEAISFELEADVRYVDPADNTPCPDFSRGQDTSENDWEAYFKVVDRNTGEALANADVDLLGRTGYSVKLKTDKKGEILTSLPIDFYEIKASKLGYAKYSMESYINRRNNDFTLELMPGKMGSVVVLRPGVKDEPKPDDVPVPVIIMQEAVDLAVEEEDLVQTPETQSEFSIETYRPNNAVFLVDVSTSMRKEDRMELLKSSMIELASILRPEDLISIVTYASSTHVILSGEPVSDIARISEVIESLEAEGKTAGEAGLKQAYKICNRHFIENGNNHVYIATDGSFNKGSEKIKKLVISKAKKDMRLSVLSIRSSKWVDEKMQDLAVAGNGQHLSIQEEGDQESLKELVKELSKR